MELDRRAKEYAFQRYQPLKPPFNDEIGFLCSPAKNRWIFGANRSGKTDTGIVDMVIRSTGIVPDSIKPYYTRQIVVPSDNWIVSLDFTNSQDVTQRKFFQYLPQKFLKKWWKGDFIAELTNGSVITFKSADSGASKFQGSVKNSILFDEECPYDVYQECFLRVRDVSGDLTGAMTPVNGITYTYDEIYLKQDLDTVCFQFTLDGNPHINELEKAKIKAKFKGADYDIRVLGKFASRVGLIYGADHFTYNTHTVEPFPITKNMYLVGALDPGLGTTGYLLMGIMPDGKCYLIDEYKGNDKTIEENAFGIKLLESKYPQGISTRLIDPSSVIRDPISKKQTRKEYTRHGLNTVLADNQIMLGIEKVWEMLKKNADGIPGLYVFRTLTNFLDEIAHYSWDKVRGNNEVTRKDKPKLHQKDHFMDCLKYIALRGEIYRDPTLVVPMIPEQGVQSNMTGY